MTPDEARALLAGTTPGPWEVDHDHAWEPGVWSPDSIIFGPYYDRQDMEQWEAGTPEDLRLAAAAPTLAAMIAGMHEEYSVRLPDGQIVGAGWGTYDTALEDQNAWRRDGYDARIVRRYVTTEEEA